MEQMWILIESNGATGTTRRGSQIVDAGDGVLSLTKLVLDDMRGGRDMMCLV
jgi:hypothetical protein